MARKWTVYQGGPNNGERLAVRVTLNSRGVILLNKAAYECMGSPGAVELMFDEEEGVIGLKPKDLRHQNAFPLKGKWVDKKKYQYRIIHASPFCKHFDIQPKSTILFTQPDMDDDGTLLLSLDTAVNVGRGSR
jgi:hypothetical protein